jgi:MFS family permease
MNKNIAALLGFWSSVFIALLGGIYLFALVASFSSEGFRFPPSPIVQLVGGIITILMVPGLLILFTAIRFVNDENNKILGSLGTSFITLFAATVSINRFVQLTVIQQSAQGIASQDLTRFQPYATGSIMFALEMLGWGFFSSFAAIFVAPLFSASRLNQSIRWLFIIYAFFSFMSIIGYTTQTPITAGAFIAWGPILMALSILLAIYFRKIDKPAA